MCFNLLPYNIKKEILQSSYCCKISYLNNNIKLNKYIFLQDIINYSYYNDNKTDVRYYLLYNNKKINVCFRGTKNFNNLLINFNIYPKKFNNNIKIHSGYLNQYLNLKNNIIYDINNICYYNNITDVIISGHSMGGALAMIASLDLYEYFKNKNISIKCYTFGTPKFANYAFNHEYHKYINNSYRFINKFDYTEKIFMIFNYSHTNNAIYLKSNYKNFLNYYNNHKINTYIINLLKNYK